MKTVKLGGSNKVSSRLVYGCMRIHKDPEKGKEAIRTAIKEGYTHFDHADIYGGGKSEQIFSEVLKEMPGIREKIIITSKCGIRGADTPFKGAPDRYDFSGDYIIKSVEGSLARLGIERLDVLLLHRPDYLFRPEEVSGAFEQLRKSGKVQWFGVSNFRPSQVSLLRNFCRTPLIMHQVEVNIHNISSLLDGTLDQCQEKGITPEAWCPLGGVAYPAWGNTFSAEAEERIKKEFSLQAEKYGVEPWIIMLAWILRHPSGILPIIGTTNSGRVIEAKKALQLDYSREDWYRLLEARNGCSVP